MFQAVTLIVCSLGGGSAIMLAVTKWGSELLTAKIKGDIEQQYKKEMAAYEKQLSDSTAKLNALLQSSTYITQKQYDLETEIYRKVWEALFDLMSCKKWADDLKIWSPQSTNVSNENSHRDQRKERYLILTNKLNDYRKAVDENAPFYQKDVYVIMKEIALEFQKINNIFFKYQSEIRLADQVDCANLDQACSEIDRKVELLVEKVRSHLQLLKCVP